jgi:hypothetical protein
VLTGRTEEMQPSLERTLRHKEILGVGCCLTASWPLSSLREFV